MLILSLLNHFKKYFQIEHEYLRKISLPMIYKPPLSTSYFIKYTCNSDCYHK